MALYRYYIHNKSIDLNCDLKQFTKEINKKNNKLKNDRDEIRRKLAIVSSSSDSSFNDYINQSSKNDLGQNLQICFMNESSNDDLVDNETSSKQSDLNNEERESKISYSFSAFSFDPNDSCDIFLTQHFNLQNEAKQALAKVQQDVKREMELDRKMTKKLSPIADIVGLSTYGVKRLEREDILVMNISQLQVIANDLCNQIEKINEDLKGMFINRDDLYVQQDALLTDIQDVTKRIQEYAKAFQKMNKNKVANKFPVSSSANAINDQPSNRTSMYPKNKLFQLSILTNKLFRFNKNK